MLWEIIPFSQALPRRPTRCGGVDAFLFKLSELRKFPCVGHEVWWVFSRIPELFGFLLSVLLMRSCSRDIFLILSSMFQSFMVSILDRLSMCCSLAFLNVSLENIWNSIGVHAMRPRSFSMVSLSFFRCPMSSNGRSVSRKTSIPAAVIGCNVSPSC